MKRTRQLGSMRFVRSFRVREMLTQMKRNCRCPSALLLECGRDGTCPLTLCGCLASSSAPEIPGYCCGRLRAADACSWANLAASTFQSARIRDDPSCCPAGAARGRSRPAEPLLEFIACGGFVAEAVSHPVVLVD